MVGHTAYVVAASPNHAFKVVRACTFMLVDKICQTFWIKKALALSLPRVPGLQETNLYKRIVQDFPVCPKSPLFSEVPP